MNATLMANTVSRSDSAPIESSQISLGYPSWGSPVYVSSPARPIKLTLHEVERLRDAAQADPTLRCILEKFTPQIDVAVTFEDR